MTAGWADITRVLGQHRNEDTAVSYQLVLQLTAQTTFWKSLATLASCVVI